MHIYGEEIAAYIIAGRLPWWTFMERRVQRI